MRMEEEGGAAGAEECRICFERGEGLIAPCLCAGTSRWIHRACLDQWRAIGSNPRSMTHCPNCGFQYQLVQDAAATEERRRTEQQRCYQFSRWLLGRTLLSFVLVQLVLCSLTVVLYACDWRAHVLVRCFDMPHPLRPAPPDDSFWGGLRYYKSTYYVAAVLVALLVLGVLATLAGLEPMCDAARNCCRQARDCNCNGGTVIGGYWCIRGCLTGYEAYGALGLTLVSFTLIGAIAAMILLVLMMQYVWHRFAQVRERHTMTQEFIVVDLSAVGAQATEAADGEARLELFRRLNSQGG